MVMTGSFKTYRPLFVGLTAVFFLVATVLPPAAGAQAFREKPHKVRAPRKKPHRAFYPRPGVYFKVHPRSHRTVLGGSLAYFFLDGIFYRPCAGGYVVVDPPIGAVVRSLPVSAVWVTIGAISYYTHAGVYYRKVPEGYRVVPQPVESAEPDATVAREGYRVRVTAALLNVRSGPGKEHPVIKQINRGDLLEVQSSSSAWYYVKLPDHSFGWVMVTYTTLVKPKAQG